MQLSGLEWTLIVFTIACVIGLVLFGYIRKDLKGIVFNNLLRDAPFDIEGKSIEKLEKELAVLRDDQLLRGVAQAVFYLRNVIFFLKVFMTLFVLFATLFLGTLGVIWFLL